MDIATMPSNQLNSILASTVGLYNEVLPFAEIAAKSQARVHL